MRQVRFFILMKFVVSSFSNEICGYKKILQTLFDENKEFIETLKQENAEIKESFKLLEQYTENPKKKEYTIEQPECIEICNDYQPEEFQSLNKKFELDSLLNNCNSISRYLQVDYERLKNYSNFDNFIKEFNFLLFAIQGKLNQTSNPAIINSNF
jgi:hypothetical protein